MSNLNLYVGRVIDDADWCVLAWAHCLVTLGLDASQCQIKLVLKQAMQKRWNANKSLLTCGGVELR